MNRAGESFRTDVIVVRLVVYAFLGPTADLLVRARTVRGEDPPPRPGRPARIGSGRSPGPHGLVEA